MGYLSVQKVTKSFGGHTVLSGVDMELDAGKIYQLIGSNGSGKTTLINIISGLFTLDSGKIIFNDKDITNTSLLDTFKSGLVRTWQIPQPFTSLTTLENFLVASTGNIGESVLGPLNLRWKKHEREIMNDASKVMKTVGLDEKVDTKSQNLSGGQLKLLELGRALMSKSKMILMDEPIAGVNPTLAHIIFKKISKICKKHKITFLIIEHRLDISLQYVDHVFALDEGKIIVEGKPDDVISHPKVVESYLGNKCHKK